MVFVQAFFNKRGSAFACMSLVENERVNLVLSPEVMAEVKEVLLRPKKIGAASPEDADAFLQVFLDKAELLEDVPKVFSFTRDPKDEPYINLAVAANVDYIVTRDTDLLDLTTGYTDECKEFRRRFRPLKVIRPEELLEIIREQDAARIP